MFQIEMVPYKQHLAVFHLPTWEQVCEFCAVNNIDQPEKELVFGKQACVYADGKGVFLLFIHKTEALESVLAHECCHIAFFLFNYIGEDVLPTKDLNEPFCYLVENLHERILDAIRRCQ